MQNRALYGIGLFASLAAVSFGCSADSGDPSSGTGGSSTTSTGGTMSTETGGTTSTTGGTTSTSTGGTTSTSTGGTTSTSTGGTTSTSTGGTTSTSTGGTTSTSTGGTTSTSTGGTTSTSTGGNTGTTGGSAATGGTTTAGATGTGGAVAGCSDGCAELKVPFAKYGTAQAFEIYLAAPTDFSTGVVTVKLRGVAGKAGGIQVVLKNPGPSYAWAQTAWLGINNTVKADWTTVTLDASAPSGMDMTNVFDKTKIAIIAIQIAAGDPWYSDMAMTMVDQTALVNPTIIQIDEITVAGVTGVGPYTFTANVTDLINGTYMPVDGSAVTWLPPG